MPDPSPRLNLQHVVLRLHHGKQRNGTLYTGVTNDIARRGFEHREGVGAGFTKRYGVKLLVYFEAHDDIQSAIEREKRIKKWNRSWKIALIESANPKWGDLYETLNS